MKKLLLVLLFSRVDSLFCSQAPLSEWECKKKVDEALTVALIDQRFNDGSGEFPRKKTAIRLEAHFPQDFTGLQAEEILRKILIHHTLKKDEVSISLTHGTENNPGYIHLTVIRANFKEAQKDYEASQPKRLAEKYWDNHGLEMLYP